MPLPAVDAVPKKATEAAASPPSMTKLALPAVEVLMKKTIAVPPPLTVKVPFPAVALLSKPTKAPFPKSSAAPLPTNVPLPALLVSRKKIPPPLPNGSCTTQEGKKGQFPSRGTVCRINNPFLFDHEVLADSGVIRDSSAADREGLVFSYIDSEVACTWTKDQLVDFRCGGNSDVSLI